MIDITKFKIKPDISSLTDDELKLWFGKDRFELIKLIENSEVTHITEEFGDYISYKKHKLSSNFMIYNISTKILFVRRDYKIFTHIIKDLFSYEIINIK